MSDGMSEEIRLSDNIKAYEAMQSRLETDHFGEWVVVYRKELIGTYPDDETAADVAIERFGRGPYLIRRIGVPPPPLSPTVLWGLAR